MVRRRAGPSAAPAAAEERLTAAAATCPVCLSVLIRPVTMPCRHTLCMPCFDSTVEQTALSCPLCRTRISVWLRKARRDGKLVDEALWRRVQDTFPDKVQARLDGREADFSEEDLEPVAQLLSAPGEIRREFEQQLEAVLDEDRERTTRSERESRELAERLQQETAEEVRRRQEQEQRDAELARGVWRQQEELFLSPGRSAPSASGGAHAGAHKPRASGSTSTPRRGPMDVYVGQLTPRVGGKRPVSPIQPRAAAGTDTEGEGSPPPPQLEATPSPTGSGKENSDPAATDGRQSSDSSDSIRAEMRHFKPIRAAPRTPQKRRPDGVLGDPALVRAVARPPGERERGRGGDGRAETPPPQLEREVVDVGGAGDSGEMGVTSTAAAGKRPAAGPSGRQRPAKRRAPAISDLDSDSRELPALSSPPPPREEPSHRALPDSDSEELFDLDSAELMEQQVEAERRLALELADRRLAEQLQKELNTLPPVDRSKGSADAYSLRTAGPGEPSSSGSRRRTPASSSTAAAKGKGRKRPAGARKTPSKGKPTARREKAQLSIQETLNRSLRAISPEW